jgi:hypothetical protein
MLGTFALSTDVAIALLSNMQPYLHIQSAQSASAVAAAGSPGVIAVAR